MPTISPVKAAAAAVGVTALVATPMLVPTASARPAPEKALRTVTVTVNPNGMKLQGTKGMHSGRFRIVVRGRGGGADVVRLAAGYSFAEANADYQASNRGDMKALRRMIKNVTFYGGLFPGQSGTVSVPKAGRYAVVGVGQKKLFRPGWFRAGTFRKTRAPQVGGRIVALDGARWGGSNHLPARGNLAFVNRSDQPHFISMAHVKQGTTRQDVIDYLSSGEQAPPPFMLPGGLDTDVLGMHQKMTVRYQLKPGAYAVMCFFPDPDMGGMPHALMGMVKIIHVG